MEELRSSEKNSALDSEGGPNSLGVECIRTSDGPICQVPAPVDQFKTSGKKVGNCGFIEHVLLTGCLIKSSYFNLNSQIENNAGLGIILQARMGSSRLPGKVAKIVGDKEYLLHQLDRVLKKCPKNQCVVATTDKSEDDVVCEIAARVQVPFFRGSSQDVLKRYIDAAECYRFTDVVRLTGDNPLIDPYIMDSIIGVYNDVDGESKYVSNNLIRTFPCGFDVEITTLRDLKEAWRMSNSDYDHEHVTPYIKRGAVSGCRRVNCSSPIDLGGWRFTLDTLADHLQLSEILLGVDGYTLEHVMSFGKQKNLLRPNQ